MLIYHIGQKKMMVLCLYDVICFQEFKNDVKLTSACAITYTSCDLEPQLEGIMFCTLSTI